MKLILAVVMNQAAESITDALLAAGFRATRMASTGGFRREGNTTIMMGVDDEDVDPALAILRTGALAAGSRRSSAAPPTAQEQPSGRGAVFIVPLEDYRHL